MSSAGSGPGSWGERLLGQVCEGRYRLEGLLGEGGMGVVFRAYDLGGQRWVALKLASGRASAVGLERFAREGQIAAQLDHAGIVRVHATGAWEGRPYLIYELVSGARELQEVWPGLPLAARVELVLQAADALGYAHGLGVVHRDVKPSNILVDESGRARLADFGIAAAEGEERLTATGAWIGTPLYMAPERFRGEAGPSVDVWALGVVLYEALTDEPPFRGATFQELAPQLALARPTPPRRLRPEVSAALEAVCLRALSGDPSQRYPSARELAEDLRRAQRGETVRGVPRGAAQGLGPLALGLATCALLGGALLYAWQPAPPSLPPASATQPSPRAAAPPGWALARGEVFTAALEWSERWTALSGPQQGLIENYQVAFELEFTVRERRGQEQTLDARFTRILLATDAARADTDQGSGPLIPLRTILGKPFVVRVELPSGRLRQVIGVDHLRDELVDRALAPARPYLAQILASFDDEAVRSQLGLAWGCGAPAGLEPGGEFESRQPYRVNQHHTLRLEGRARGAATRVEWSAPQLAAIRLPRGARLGPGSAAGWGEFVAGRVQQSEARCEVEFVEPSQTRRLEFQLRYEERAPR